MKKFCAVLFMMLFIQGCTSGELLPAKVLSRVIYVDDIHILMDVIEVIEYGHFMNELMPADRLEVFTHRSYQDSTHLVGQYHEFLIKKEYNYWELVE